MDVCGNSTGMKVSLSWQDPNWKQFSKLLLIIIFYSSEISSIVCVPNCTEKTYKFMKNISSRINIVYKIKIEIHNYSLQNISSSKICSSPTPVQNIKSSSRLIYKYIVRWSVSNIWSESSVQLGLTFTCYNLLVVWALYIYTYTYI